jgi:hypothetical protein
MHRLSLRVIGTNRTDLGFERTSTLLSRLHDPAPLRAGLLAAERSCTYRHSFPENEAESRDLRNTRFLTRFAFHEVGGSILCLLGALETSNGGQAVGKGFIDRKMPNSRQTAGP